MPVKVTKMLYCTVPTVPASAVHHTIVQALAIATLCPAEVMGHKVNTEEAYKRIKFSDPILKRRPAKAPAVHGGETKGRLCRLGGPAFDSVGFVEDDAPPADRVQDAHAGALRGLLHELLQI